jgi:hypothetical protein
MDGHADTPQERALAKVLTTSEDMFVRLWQEAWDAEQQPVEAVNWPTEQHQLIEVSTNATKRTVKSHPIHMSNKVRREWDRQAPKDHLICSKCEGYKHYTKFSLERTPGLEYRGFRKAMCKACCAESS